MLIDYIAITHVYSFCTILSLQAYRHFYFFLSFSTVTWGSIRNIFYISLGKRMIIDHIFLTQMFIYFKTFLSFLAYRPINFIFNLWHVSPTSVLLNSMCNAKCFHHIFVSNRSKLSSTLPAGYFRTGVPRL